MEYNFDKKYIKCSIPPEDSIVKTPDNILLPFFIEYSSLFPFIQFIFKKNQNNEIDFIDTNQYFHFPHEYILENEFYQSYTTFAFLQHHSIFYEIKNKNTPHIPLDFSGTYYNDDTHLWFASTYEIYHSKKIYNLQFANRVIQFFLDNPQLEFISWDSQIQPTPIIAFSNSNIKDTLFQSTFGSTFSSSSPHFTLYKEPLDHSSPVVRYAVFQPFTENENTIHFDEHKSHIPICYSSYFFD
jgi:hypothetical protein